MGLSASRKRASPDYTRLLRGQVGPEGAVVGMSESASQNSSPATGRGTSSNGNALQRTDARGDDSRERTGHVGRGFVRT